MNQNPSNRPIFNSLQTPDSSDMVEQVIDGSPELVFRSPTIKETIGNTTFVILIFAFGLPIILIGALSFFAGNKAMLSGLLVLPGFAVISLGLSFLLQKGRIVLKSDKLI